MKKRDSLLIALGILFISFNLRAPITAVGSLAGMIKGEFGFSNAAAGFITTLPLIAFAAVSPFVTKMTDKLGHSVLMMAGLFLITAGVLIRSYTGWTGLFFGTAVIGTGIAIGNVLIPAIIKLHFSHNPGAMTSVYTFGMCIFAAVGAGISVPLAKGMELGWKNALAVWAILSVVTAIIWLPQLLNKQENRAGTEHKKGESSIWLSPLAWWVTLFMGAQSLLFYSLVAWMPTIITSKGLSPDFAGNMALLFQLMAIPSTVIFPALCDRFRDQRGLVLATCAIYGSGIVTLLFSHSALPLVAATTLMSIGMGASISLSITFISLRSPNPHRAAELSGMSQSAGYLFAALGPIVTGHLFDLYEDWTIPVILFVILVLFLALCGMQAGSRKTVEE